MFRITRRWIFEFRTDRGAWTYAQWKAIGVPIPPEAGWIDEFDGREITDEQKAAFEAGRTVYRWKRDRRRIRRILESGKTPAKLDPSAEEMDENFADIMRESPF